MKTRIWPYLDSRNDQFFRGLRMPTKRTVPPPQDGESFGKRLARLRKAAGYSQRDLAKEINISQRMIAYYEIQTTHPPTHLLHVFAKALGASTDQLLGVEKVKETKQKDSRLWRRFSQVEKLPPDQRKKIVDILDAFLKAGKS